MRFGYTILYVENPKETVAFYEKAFGLLPKFVMEDGSYAEMDTGSTTLSFCAKSLAEHNVGLTFPKSANHAPMEVAFIVDDVHEAYNYAINHGAVSVLAPVSKPWGQMVSYVQDNNGFLVELCSAIT